MNPSLSIVDITYFQYKITVKGHSIRLEFVSTLRHRYSLLNSGKYILSNDKMANNFNFVKSDAFHSFRGGNFFLLKRRFCKSISFIYFFKIHIVRVLVTLKCTH